MSDALTTYLQDHLAGARFAIELLNGLSEQTSDSKVADFARRLLEEVESDCSILQDLVDRLGSETSRLKEAAAWMAQKASRVKLDLKEPLGVFEAIEMLALGVQGKLALWDALRAVRGADSRLSSLDIETLASRAIEQHLALEELRLQLAHGALKQ